MIRSLVLTLNEPAGHWQVLIRGMPRSELCFNTSILESVLRTHFMAAKLAAERPVRRLREYSGPEVMAVWGRGPEGRRQRSQDSIETFCRSERKEGAAIS